MDNTLNATIIRLDENMQNLAQNALAQIILKILYSSKNRMTVNEVNEKLSEANAGKHISVQDITEMLVNLKNSGVEHSNGKYYLTTPKRKEIEKSVIASQNRRKAIIDHYFSRLNSDRDIIEDWFIDVTLRFFESYSDDWISDVMQKGRQIVTKRDSIVNMIVNRTNENKKIKNSDKTELPQRFLSFINESEKEVDEYLWECGTSAFAAKLIRSTFGVDAIALETFKNSHCILDTNILIFIALESRYKDAFKAIEKVFKSLNIGVGILYITKKEYESKIGYQRKITLANIEKLGPEIALLPDDDFTKAAQQRHCKTKDDFIRFFDYGLKQPKMINNCVNIQLLDNSKELVEAVDNAKNDERLKKDLNSKRVLILGRDKSASSLSHDAGLIEGVNYLRNDPKTSGGKFFILSEDGAVNQYSKRYGFVHNLPLSIRVSTLINMLAVNNGGDIFIASDYAPLFANIIRMGLTPAKDTFRQSELYEYSQMDDRLESLPTDMKERIVLEAHKKSLDGIEQKELLRDLRDMVTNGEVQTGIKLKDTSEKLQRTEQKLENEQKEKNRYQEVAMEGKYKEAEKEYDDRTAKMKKTRWVGILATTIGIFILSYFGGWFDSKIWSFGVSPALSVLSGVIVYFITNNPIKARKQNRDESIKKIARDKLDKALKEKDSTIQ